MPRNRPRRTPTSQIKTVLQAFRYECSRDIDAFDSMVLSLAEGEGVGVKKRRLAKIKFRPKWLAPEIGEKVNW